MGNTIGCEIFNEGFDRWVAIEEKGRTCKLRGWARLNKARNTRPKKGSNF